MIIPPVAHFMVICLLATSKGANGAIGLNWGRVSVQRLIPSIVVDLLLQNGVQRARIYTAQQDILEAFYGSGIHLTIGIFNLFAITNDDDANAWVQQKIIPYYGPANIRQIYIGNYAFMYGFHNQTFRGAGVRTLELVQKALNKAGYGDHIKATMPHTSIVLKGNITRPSEAEFKDEIIEDMKKTLQVLHNNGAPFVVDIFPALYVRENIHMGPSFAFADNDSTQFVTDVNGAVYTNVFDFVYDAYVWALEKVGAGDLQVVVGQVGWPTDGYPGANSAAAERFFKTLLPNVASNKGTPKCPGRQIVTYVHSLTDESKMPADEPFTRHWGIYRSNGEPKYKIDLTGQGRDIFPPRAKGIMRMPDRWCMFNNNTGDAAKLDRQARRACRDSDCTSLAPGGSCSQLDFYLKISYTFNMYFQTMFQDENACNFEGLGMLVMENPSTAECVFPVEVVRGHQFDFEKPIVSYGEKMHQMPGCSIFVLLLSTILWALF